MLTKIEKKDLEKIYYLFNDIRFYLVRSVLQGLMGEAYVNDTKNPTFAILLVRHYCFMSGNIGYTELKELVNRKLKARILIPSDNIKELLEVIFKDEIIKRERYSIKKNPKFNVEQLQRYVENLSDKYTIKMIDKEIAERIKDKNFINISHNYEKVGIGYCCLFNDDIIGVASSNFFYNDGIEVNIRVSEEHRRNGIATALASQLILKCIEENKKVSWDAANKESVGLAQKLGFEYDSMYNVYDFKKEGKK